MLPAVLRWISCCVLCFASIAVAACGPKIGDDCTDSLDCATDGSRFCDFTQPDGYCLIPNCHGDECPEDSVCVQFGTREQARTFCMSICEDDGDCRDAYRCAAPDSGADVPTEIVDTAPLGDRFCLERTE
jgi:hypothetical protein